MRAGAHPPIIHSLFPSRLTLLTEGATGEESHAGATAPAAVYRPGERSTGPAGVAAEFLGGEGPQGSRGGSGPEATLRFLRTQALPSSACSGGLRRPRPHCSIFRLSFSGDAPCRPPFLVPVTANPSLVPNPSSPFPSSYPLCTPFPDPRPPSPPSLPWSSPHCTSFPGPPLLLLHPGPHPQLWSPSSPSFPPSAPFPPPLPPPRPAPPGWPRLPSGRRNLMPVTVGSCSPFSGEKRRPSQERQVLAAPLSRPALSLERARAVGAPVAARRPPPPGRPPICWPGFPEGGVRGGWGRALWVPAWPLLGLATPQQSQNTNLPSSRQAFAHTDPCTWNRLGPPLGGSFLPV